MEWKDMWSMDGLLFSFVSTLGTGLITAWILTQAPAGEVSTHIYFGTPFLAIWIQGMSRTGLVLQREYWQGTLELLLPSRSSLLLLMTARSVAIGSAGLLPAALILVIIATVTDSTPTIASAGEFAAACLMALLAVIATSLLFSPLTFLYARRAPVLNAVWPIGAALGGFLYAPERLPTGLEAVSHLLPTTWAIEAVVLSATGEGGGLWQAWLLTMTSVGLVVMVTAWLFRLADHRLRTSGVLAR